MSKKPEVVWGGRTPVTPISAKERRKIGKRIKKRHEWLRKRYPEVKPLAVELWIRDLKLAGKSKSHIRDMMHLLFNWAMRWELIPIERNPMSLVRVKGSSKRTKLPRILTIKEFDLLLERLKEPGDRKSVLAE